MTDLHPEARERMALIYEAKRFKFIAKECRDGDRDGSAAMAATSHLLHEIDALRLRAEAAEAERDEIKAQLRGLGIRPCGCTEDQVCRRCM